MKGLFWLLAVFAAAIALALSGRFDAGYVLFVIPPWRVEVSLLLFLGGLLVAFLVLYALLGLARRVLAIPVAVRGYRDRRRRDRANRALAEAMQAMFEGRYARAAKEAARAHEAGASPGLAALIAARAAHQLRNFEQRDHWLEESGKAGEAMRAARSVTRAELALEERDFAAARDALRSLHDAGPKHIATLRMLLRAERGAGNWEEVARLAAQLAKRDAIAPAVSEEYRVQAQVALLERDAVDRKAFEQRWRGIASREQAHPRVAEVAGKLAASLGLVALARDILERALAAEWNATLGAQYGDLPGLEPAARVAEARARIERAEKWLRDRPEDATLLGSLGRLCAHAELWGKAQSYFEASLGYEESAAAHLELARLAERLGRQDDAQVHFRRAAELH